MKINWVFLFVCVVLLWIRIPFSSELRRRWMDARQRTQDRVGGLFLLWQNWVDLIRAAAATNVLINYAVLLEPDAKTGGVKVLMVQALVLSVGVLIQIFIFERRVQLLAPVFYLTGVTLVLPGWAQGGFAVFVGWLFTLGGKNALLQLPTMGVALGIAGYILGLSLPLMFNCTLIFLPLVLAVLTQKPFVFPTRM